MIKDILGPKVSAKKLLHIRSTAANDKSMSMSMLREGMEVGVKKRGWESTIEGGEGDPLKSRRPPCRRTGLARADESHHVLARGCELETGVDVRRRVKRYHKEQISRDEQRVIHQRKADTLLPRTRRCSTTCLGSATDGPEQRQPLLSPDHISNAPAP